MRILAWAAAPLMIAVLLSSAAAREVWHTARSLMPGDTLRSDDVRAVEVPPARDRFTMLDAERPIIGLEVKRRLAAGMALHERDIGERDLVRASQPVRVFWKSAGMTLELQGRALENGPAGAEIRISNPSSGRTFRAIVVAEGTAEITAAP